MNLVKCKRPASALLDDMDYEIEQGTGRLIPLGSELPSYIHTPVVSVETESYEPVELW